MLDGLYTVEITLMVNGRLTSNLPYKGLSKLHLLSAYRFESAFTSREWIPSTARKLMEILLFSSCIDHLGAVFYGVHLYKSASTSTCANFITSRALLAPTKGLFCGLFLRRLVAQ
jgi:hypothetical protein